MGFDLERMRAEIAEGLRSDPKRIPPKYFYDERGAELFERITRLPEYYLTRAERRLLSRHAGGLARRTGMRTFVELGAGGADKSRLILDAMIRAHGAGVYVPVDVSGAHLMAAAERLAAEYGELRILPVIADFTADYELPPALPRPALHALLGSTLGNFVADDGVALLHRIRPTMSRGDRLLLGVDLHKDRATLEAAYNDAAGVTAEFNRNVLRVLNRRLGADFDPTAFGHRAYYDEARRCISMYLVSQRAQKVRIPGIGELDLERGESIHTEDSCKYDRDSVERLLDAADLALEQWLPDDAGEFALAMATIP